MEADRDASDLAGGAERRRLAEDAARHRNWKRWGPYLSERQWGTVREDYSPDGSAWAYFPHDHARSRAYRWGEDGLLGLCDRECRLCFSIALWNEKDSILKERLFGLAGQEGNHGEDCKELYYYLDATPTYSYARALYKYPQAAYPYSALRPVLPRSGPLLRVLPRRHRPGRGGQPPDGVDGAGGQAGGGSRMETVHRVTLIRIRNSEERTRETAGVSTQTKCVTR